jgi:hypothetical protein
MSVAETLNAINDPELLPDICATVAGGGNLAALCRDRSLDYKLVNRWIADDEDRAHRYKLALDIREQHAKDLIIGELISYIRAKPVDAFTAIEVDGGVRQAMLPIAEMPEDLQRLIAGYEFEEVFEWVGQGKDREKLHVGRMHKIKFYDKPRSIETFMKHLAMLVDRKDVNVKHSLADLIAGEPEKQPA